MEKLLDANVKKQVQEVFAELKEPVEILFFGSQADCAYCEQTQQLLEEVVELSDKLHLSVYDLERDAETAKQYKVSSAPATIIAARDGAEITDYGIRFLGIMAGHEFTSLINDLMVVSGRASGLSQQGQEFLAGLKQPVRMQVFVTPT